MSDHPFPLSGGRYRLIDGQLVADDGAPARAETPADGDVAAPESTDPAPAPRGRRKHTED